MNIILQSAFLRLGTHNHLAFNLNFTKAELFGHGDTVEKNLTFFFSFTIYNFVENLEKGSLTSRLIIFISSLFFWLF